MAWGQVVTVSVLSQSEESAWGTLLLSVCRMIGLDLTEGDVICALKVKPARKIDKPYTSVNCGVGFDFSGIVRWCDIRPNLWDWEFSYVK